MNTIKIGIILFATSLFASAANSPFALTCSFVRPGGGSVSLWGTGRDVYFAADNEGSTQLALGFTRMLRELDLIKPTEIVTHFGFSADARECQVSDAFSRILCNTNAVTVRIKSIEFDKNELVTERESSLKVDGISFTMSRFTDNPKSYLRWSIGKDNKTAETGTLTAYPCMLGAGD